MQGMLQGNDMQMVKPSTLEVTTQSHLRAHAHAHGAGAWPGLTGQPEADAPSPGIAVLACQCQNKAIPGAKTADGMYS